MIYYFKVFIGEWGAAQMKWAANDVKLLTANVIINTRYVFEKS
jgi:hypothetical protein